MRLIGAILAGIPSVPGAACRGRYGLFDDRIDGETREQHHQRYTARRSLLTVPGHGRGVRVAGLIVFFRALGKRRSRLQDQCNSRIIFHKITDSGQIAHLDYWVCRARVIDHRPVMLSTVHVSNPASQVGEAGPPSESTTPSSARTKYIPAPAPFLYPISILCRRIPPRQNQTVTACSDRVERPEPRHGARAYSAAPARQTGEQDTTARSPPAPRSA